MLFEKQVLDHPGLHLGPIQMAAHKGHHLAFVAQAALAQAAGLCFMAKQFIRIRFRSIPRQMNQSQTLHIGFLLYVFLHIELDTANHEL